MDIQSILVPIDFSESSDEALRFGAGLAKETDAKLHLVHVDSVINVTPPAGTKPGQQLDAPWGHERQEVRQRLEQYPVPEPGLDCQRHYLTGAPARHIIDFAKQHNVDLIVIGSHGRTGFSKLLMGSVTESVLRGAPCPVLVVKHPKAARE